VDDQTTSEHQDGQKLCDETVNAGRK